MDRRAQRGRAEAGRQGPPVRSGARSPSRPSRPGTRRIASPTRARPGRTAWCTRWSSRSKADRAPRPCASCTAGSSATTGSPSTRHSLRATRCTSTSWLQYVRFFRGRPVAVIEHFQPGHAERRRGDVRSVRGALGLGDAAALGDAVRLDAAGLGPVEGSRGLPGAEHDRPAHRATRCTGSRSFRWVAASTSATTSTATTSTSRPSRRPGRPGSTGPLAPARRRPPADRLAPTADPVAGA